MAAARGGTGNGATGGPQASGPSGSDRVAGARSDNAPKRGRTQNDQAPRDERARPSSAEPPNSIRASRPRKRSAQEDWRAQSGQRTDPSTASRGRGQQRSLPYDGRQSDAAAEPEEWNIPASVRDRFHQDGHRFYFPDGKPAFRDHGRRLTTPSENTQVVASLIEIAQARGWDSIAVAGTERFRQEAWKQGKLAGLKVRGYRASDPERAALIRLMSHTAAESRPPASSAATAPSRASAPEPPQPPVDDARAAAERKAKAGVFAGKLLDHGVANYKFDRAADPSYYVRLQTPEGRRTVWGQDFERAIRESLSQPAIGDQVVLQHHGSQGVTVKRRERDDAGAVVNESWVDTHRNQWTLEKREFRESRAVAADALRNPTLDPRRTAHAHPELAGTLLQLRAAELAAKRMADPGDRVKFLSIVRNAMADAVERGERLEPVRLRDQPARRATPGRERAPTR